MNGPPPTITLAPGKSNLGRYLLNYNHEINAPGNYWVQAEFVGNTAVARPPIRLTFRVDGNLPPWSAAQYQSWLDQLNSTVFEQRLEAARTLASLAPVSLETILLDFANHYDTRIYAPLALYRLNTPRSMEALAGLMKSPDSFTRWDAAHYLAESGDQKWYPLLLDAAQKNPGEGGVYLVAAAQLGGDRMLPVLAAWAKDNEHQPVRANVILAIEATHSRSAIPILLDLLNSRDHKTSDGAQYSLQRLTHRSAFQNRRFRNRKSEARKWQEWWVREGSTATIYKDLCEKPVPLP
jgi:HEAT repeat protein